MDDTPRYAGHLTPGCEGHWINISSLAQMEFVCSECRATVADPEALEDQRAMQVPPEGSGPRWASWSGIWPFLLGLFIGSLLVGLILGASLYYQIR